MHSLIIAVVCSATPIGPSPALLQNVTFADESFVTQRTDEQLSVGTWPVLFFPSPGVVVVRDGGEYAQYDFTATPTRSGYRLVLHDTMSIESTAYWRWLDDGRASTNLWFGSKRIASRAHPSPWDRREAYGLRLAAKELRPGEFRDGDGPVFKVQSDGSVMWSRPNLRGTFFSCRRECTPEARVSLCLKFEGPSDNGLFITVREYLFESKDGHVVGTPVEQTDSCGAREPTPGYPLRQ